MKWKIILFMMVMLMLELVHAAPSISLDILSNDTYNTSNSIFNLTLTGNGQCNGGNTSWWNSTGKQQILGLDFNVNETDNNFWDYTGNNNNGTCLGGANCPIFQSNGKISLIGLQYIISIPFNYSKDTFTMVFFGNYSFVTNKFLYSTLNNYRFNIYESGGFYRFWYVDTAGADQIITTNISSLNETAMLTIISNTTNLILWKNTSSYFRTAMTNPKKDIVSLVIGVDSGNTKPMTLDSFYFFNRSLSLQEVSELYNSSVAKRSPRLLSEQTTNGDIWQGNAVCSNTTAYSTIASEILYISDCITLLANTSYSSWLNISSCDFYDHLSQSSNFTTYDANNCGTFSNITYNATQNTSCIFCAGQNISLCTYQTNKMEGENMLFGLILIPLVLGIMFLVASFLMSEEHTIIKIFFFGLSFLSATASLYMGSVGITYIDPADTTVQAAIGNMMQWVSWVDYIILIYIFIYVTIHLLKALKQDKEEKLKY